MSKRASGAGRDGGAKRTKKHWAPSSGGPSGDGQHVLFTCDIRAMNKAVSECFKLLEEYAEPALEAYDKEEQEEEEASRKAAGGEGGAGADGAQVAEQKAAPTAASALDDEIAALKRGAGVSSGKSGSGGGGRGGRSDHDKEKKGGGGGDGGGGGKGGDARGKQLFNDAHLRAKGWVMMRINHPALAANDLVQAAYNDIIDNHAVKSRHMVRLYPVQHVCVPNLQEVLIKSGPLIKSVMGPEAGVAASTFRIDVVIR